MLADITLYKNGVFGNPGAKAHQVVAGGTPPAINAGEPVNKTLGNEYVITAPSSGQAVATNFMAGISTTTSTESATLDGSVDVIPLTPGTIWLIKPKVSATWFGSGSSPSQATYNALVGLRVLIDKTSGAYTILASDGSTNGCVVENLNVVTYPGLVAFSFRQALSYTA